MLIHAWQDDATKMSIKHRRDSFCGKMSACNNLKQYGIPYSITVRHTMDPNTKAFENEVHTSAAVCRVVKGLRGCRIGALGARPAAFNTVRYSEKLFQDAGMPQIENSVDTRIVVIEIEIDKEPVLVGLTADRVYEVTEILQADAQQTPRVGMHWKPEFIHFITKWRDEFVIVPNIERILN